MTACLFLLEVPQELLLACSASQVIHGYQPAITDPAQNDVHHVMLC